MQLSSVPAVSTYKGAFLPFFGCGCALLVAYITLALLRAARVSSFELERRLDWQPALDRKRDAIAARDSCLEQ